LKVEIGGVARAMGDTATGSLKILNNAFGDLKEVAGETIVQGIQPVVKWLTDVISSAAASATEIRAVNKALKEIQEGKAVSDIDAGIKAVTLEIEKARAGLTGYAETSTDIMNIMEGTRYETEELREANDAYIVSLENELKQLQEKKKLRELEAERDKARTEAEKKAAEEAIRQQEEKLKKIKWMDDAYAKSHEGQLAAAYAEWQAHKANLEMLEKIGGVTERAIITTRDAKAAYDELLASEVEISKDAYHDLSEMFDDYQKDLAKKAYEGWLKRKKIIEEEVEREKKKEEEIKQFKQKLLDSVVDIWGQIDSVVSAAANRELQIMRRQHDQELDDLQRQHDLELELEGFQGTEEEKAALAEDFKEQEAALAEEFRKEEARLEFEAAMRSWKLQLLGALAAVARSIVEAAKNAWPFPAIPMMGLAGVMGGVQVAAIHAARPVPTYAEGVDMIVPPGYPNDSFLFRAESGEHLQVTPRGGIENIISAPVIIQIDSGPIYKGLLRATQNGIALVHPKGISKR